MWHYLTKYEKASTSSLKCEYISSYEQGRNISCLKAAHWYGLNFLYFFIRSENLNLNFSERKGINFCRVQMIYVHPLTLNYPLQYAKRLSNIIARYAAAVYTYVVWVISWAMWLCNTFQGCNINSDILK